MRRVVRCDARYPHHCERGDSNGKESEGRKEEGGQEEIRPIQFQLPNPDAQPRQKGIGSWPSVRVHAVTDPDVSHHIPLHQLIDDVHAGHDAAEHRVSSIQVWLW